MENIISSLFNIKYPIIQGGMVWCSGYKLAAAVSNAGGLGLLGAGSMYPEILREQIRKTKAATQLPFGVNIPLLYPDLNDIMKIIMDEGIEIVFTSAGNPKTWTKTLQQNGATVVHVVANTKFALKCEEAGVNAIVAEGFEAGGHNGREETTTLALIPQIRKATQMPLMAAGGIATGSAMLAAMVLGADGVQIGTRFVASEESSAHENFKNVVIQATEGSTFLALKKLVPVRLLRNKFASKIEVAELRGAQTDELELLLGKARAKLGMYEGNMTEGELEIGQVAALIDSVKPAAEIINEIMNEYRLAKSEIVGNKYDI